MKQRFFDPQNTFWHWLGKIPDIFLLSLLWIVCCLPVLTIAPATIALYDAVARKLRPDEKGLLRRYFSTFRKELGRGIVLSLLWGVVALVLYSGNAVVSSQAEAGGAAAVYALVYQVTLLIPLAIFHWQAALESRFSYSLPQLWKVSVLFTVSYLPKTFVILVLDFLALVALRYIPVLFCVLPTLLTLLHTIPIEKAFAPLMEAAEEAQ